MGYCNNPKHHTIEERHQTIDELSHKTKTDQEAILGKDHAKDFDDLSEEDSKKKLSIIVVKIDNNKDLVVTKEELTLWIKKQSTDYIIREAKKSFEKEDTDNNGKVSW